MPRQKTAFASEELRVRAAAKDTRAAPSKMNTRMGYGRPAIQTLERLHAELGGKILENKQEHENAGQMRHVEAVIRMLDPGYSLRAISVKRRQSIHGSNGVPFYRRA